ncbi:hypothetical protein DITRI_Ditri07aG0106200 [Diplodiscus trichospermus]
MMKVTTMAELLGKCTVALARVRERLFTTRPIPTLYFRRLTNSSSAAGLNQDSSFLVYF